MKQSPRCHRRTIGGDGSFRVELCGCGAVHLTIGFVTMRLDPRAYRELMRAVDEAGRVLDSVADPILH